MSNFNWTAPYAPAQAEDGKFIPLSQSYLTDTFSYPATASGRFALLVKAADTISSTQIKSAIVSPTASIVFTPNISELQIYNKGTDVAYILLSATSNYAAVSSQGWPLAPSATFIVDNLEISNLTVVSQGTSDVRILGYS